MTPALSYLIQAILMILPGAVFTILPLYVVKYELDAETSFLQKAFCFFHASMMVSFCYLYAKLLTAPLEIANDTGAPLL